MYHTWKYLRFQAPILALAVTGCSSESISGLGFPQGITSVSDQSLPLWQGAWIAAAVVGIFTAILIMWPVFFHRKKDNEFPKQVRYNIPIEIAYTVIPFIIVAVLFVFTIKAENEVTRVTPKSTSASAEKIHDITVNAFQWAWQFTYPEAGEKATVTGTPANPAILYLPQGERVRFTLTSSDVVHGFWVPEFMIQIQNIPGVVNHLEFSANKLGTYAGRCNMLCGRSHSKMLFSVKVVTPAEYESYIQSLKAAQA